MASKTRKRPDDWCPEILGMGFPVGVVVCVLPRGHDGPHDGGEAERQLGEAFVARQLEREAEHEFGF